MGEGLLGCVLSFNQYFGCNYLPVFFFLQVIENIPSISPEVIFDQGKTVFYRRNLLDPNRLTDAEFRAYAAFLSLLCPVRKASPMVVS